MESAEPTHGIQCVTLGGPGRVRMRSTTRYTTGTSNASVRTGVLDIHWLEAMMRTARGTGRTAKR
jgi:hypothetical protein